MSTIPICGFGIHSETISHVFILECINGNITKSGLRIEREVIYFFKHSSQNVTHLAMFTHGTPTAYLKVGNGDILTRNIISAILVTMAGAEVDGFPSLTAGSQNASID